ncbi:MAG: hypothetical protein ACKOEO_15800, partial [Planctomycetaceae bacterium]
PFGEFIVDAISAGQDVLINARGATTIGGKLSATHGQLSITTASSLSVNGLQPGNSTSADAIAAPATLRSPVTVTLNAAGEINIGESAVVSSTGIGGGEGRILINTTAQAVLSGEFEAFDDVVVNAASSITLDGRITAGNLIDINAGQSAAGSGSVNGTFFAELVTQNPGSEVILSAGALSGSISLVNSSISADIRVSLAAPAGSISHGPGETITADLVQARAATGIEARTNAPEVDFATSAAGGITLTNLQALTAVVTAANGPVDITSMGTLNAVRVEALGSSAANGITLRAEAPVPSEKSHLLLGNLTSSSVGNMTFTARGTVTGINGLVRGNRLVVMADTIPELTTEVSFVSLSTLEPGSVQLTQFGSQPLTIDALIRDGAFVVDHALGDVTLNDITIVTNSDENDLTVTAGGSIGIGAVRLGDFYTSADQLPLPGDGAVGGTRSLGDITLTSGGSVVQSTVDGAVDLVGDLLTISAQTGIGLLQTAVHDLIASTPRGSISIEDTDSYGELGLGLNILSVEAPLGNVTLQGNRSVDVVHVVAGGNDGFLRLTSLAGNLKLIEPDTGDAISYYRGVALSAGKTLDVYRFFAAPTLMEYRGDEIVIEGITDRLGIPSALEGDTIILEQRNGIRLKNQTSLRAERLELLTDRNLSIQAGGSISAGVLVMRAQGTENVRATVYNPATGGTQTIEQPTGGIR